MTSGQHDSISVALCTRNGERFIAAQLDSIVAQSLKPTEIIISDDASNDTTLALVDEIWAGFAASGRTAGIALTVLSNPAALGVSANFEQAARASSGDIVVLCDQDDVWHPNRLAAGIAALEAAAGATLAFSDARLVDAGGQPLGLTLFDALEVSDDTLRAVRSEAAFAVLLRRNIVTGATVLFRRSLLASALPFGTGWIHDEWLAIMAAATSRLAVTEAPLIDYRQHSLNEIGVRRATIAIKIRRVLEPRGERNQQLSLRSVVLAERLRALDGIDENFVNMADEKVRVETMRANLPASRWRRVAIIGLANGRGWYSRYCSQGRLDMVRDLLQSHH